MQNNTITLKGVTETHIILAVNGKEHEILLNSNAFEQFFQSYNQTTFQSGNTIYNIEEIKTATFVFQIKSIAPKPKHLNRIPLALPPKVIGRKNDLEKVEELLFKDNALVIVNGIGGIGKTVLSHYYWQERQYKYTHLLWLKGEGNLQDSLIYDYNLHAGLGIVEEMKYHLEAIRQPNNAQAKEQAFACVAAALKNVTPKGLMLIDNASEENSWMIKQWKTTFDNFHILVTSRIIFDDVATHSLGFLNKEEAKELFYLYYDSDNKLLHNDNAVEEITWFAGYHTLTIELLAKTLKTHKRLTFESLLFQLHQNPVYLSQARKIGTPYTPTEDYIYNILELCFDLSEITKDKNVENLLRYFSILPSYGIKGCDLIEILNIMEEAEETYDNTLKTLVNNGWVKERYENEYVYDCHAIIQTIVREKLKPIFENCGEIVSNLGNIIEKYYKINPLYPQKLLHYVTEILVYLTEDNTEMARLYNDVATVYRVIGNYSTALTFALKDIAICEKVLGNNHIDVATSYNTIAGVYLCLGKYSIALDYYLKSKTIKENILNGNDLSLCISYNNIANTYQKLGKNDDALNFALKSKTIYEEVLGENHIDVATVYTTIATIYESLENYKMALSYDLKAVVIAEKDLDKNHVLLATCYNNIANTYICLEDVSSALTFVLKAIAIREKILGKNHYSLSISYSVAAVCYKKQEDYQKSLSFDLKAKTIKEKSLSNNHDSLAISYHNIADTYFCLDDLENAINYEQNALIIFFKSLPNGHYKIKKAVNKMNIFLDTAIKAEGHAKYQSELEWFQENCFQYR